MTTYGRCSLRGQLVANPMTSRVCVCTSNVSRSRSTSYPRLLSFPDKKIPLGWLFTSKRKKRRNFFFLCDYLTLKEFDISTVSSPMPWAMLWLCTQRDWRTRIGTVTGKSHSMEHRRKHFTFFFLLLLKNPSLWAAVVKVKNTKVSRRLLGYNG